MEKNIDLLTPFPMMHLEQVNKTISLDGLYLNKKGYLIFLLSTFNSNPLPKNIINFYKLKIKVILELCNLKECYVYRYHYDEITRHNYLTLKRNPCCLWTFENLDTSQYFRITNFEHDIINVDSGLKDKYFPEEIPKFSRKRKASESDLEEERKKQKRY